MLGFVLFSPTYSYFDSVVWDMTRNRQAVTHAAWDRQHLVQHLGTRHRSPDKNPRTEIRRAIPLRDWTVDGGGMYPRTAALEREWPVVLLNR